ncbi:hypothetical protein Aduo_009317 [Ancylostoma duodenale]
MNPDLTILLSKNQLHVVSEEDVFNAAMRWVEHALERAEVVDSVLTCVRLHLLDKIFLVNKVALHPIIRGFSACREMVEEVKDFHLTGAKRLIPSLLSRPQRCCDFGWAIFVAGGRRNGKLLSGVESYDPVKKRWKHMRPMSLPRVDFGIAVNGNNKRSYTVYAIGGGIPNLGETGVTVCKMECYDIIKKSWRQLASMREPRCSPSVTFVGDTLYVCGGGNGIILATNNVEIYNPKTNLWQAGVPMLKCRRAAGIAVLNRCVYVMGGCNGASPLPSVERFDPKIGRWEEMPPMRRRRAFFGAAVMNGKIYVCGGTYGGRDSSWVQVYHGDTGIWELGTQLNAIRSGVSAAVVSLPSTGNSPLK